MGGVADRMAAVIAVRRNRLPEVGAEIAAWRRVDGAVEGLAAAIERLYTDPVTLARVAAHVDQLRVTRARVAELRPAVTAAIGSLQQLEHRIGRGALCIGVAGAARAGKTTVLRSISGLSDAWLPTANRGPVTAVPSRILHTPGRSRAVVEPHTFDTFQAAHLRPRYLAAGLGEPPADIEEFRAARYPGPGTPGYPLGQRVQLARLREMQEALWSYEGLLDRNGKVVELGGDEVDRLREYVAYPTAAWGGRSKPAARRYLGVRQVRIECAFPHAELGPIMLVDLPGLGDPAGVGRCHLARLRHDLDVVLLIRRSTGGPATSGDDADTAALDTARGIAGRHQDFIVVVLNTGTGVRGGLPGPDVLEVDAGDPADVSTRLIGPVLEHLAERLPAMDADLFAGARAATGPVRDELVELAVEARAVIRQLCRPGQGGAVDLYRRADELHATIAAALHALLTRLRSTTDGDDHEYVSAVNDVYAGIISWVREGLGIGYDHWYAAARRGLTRDGGAGRFVAAESARIRREIDHRYHAVDRLLGRRLAQLWTDVGTALAGGVGALLGDRSGASALAHLAGLAATAVEPSPLVEAACRDLLAVRLDYRTHLRAAVRTELHPLDLSGREWQEPAGRDPARLYRIVSGRAERAAFRARARLLTETALPGRVLYPAVEEFTDTLLGSVGAEQEIRHLARAYRHVLWPGVFVGLEASDAPVARVVQAAGELLDATTELGGRRR